MKNPVTGWKMLIKGKKPIGSKSVIIKQKSAVMNIYAGIQGRFGLFGICDMGSVVGSAMVEDDNITGFSSNLSSSTSIFLTTISI
jgi:hypothetical protein